MQGGKGLHPTSCRDEIICEGCVERGGAKKREGRKPVQGSAEGQGRPLPYCTGHSSGAVFKQIHPGKVERKVDTTLIALGPTCPKQHEQHGGSPGRGGTH